MRGLRVVLPWVFLLLSSTPALAQQAVQAKAQVGVAPDVKAGLDWLQRKQGRDGSWGEKNKLALTGMSGLALLASGSTPQRGPYAEAIRRSVNFVLSCQKRDGRAFMHVSSGYSEIHNHGYALLLLTQAYGEGGPLDRKLRVAISLGIKATIASQFSNKKSNSDGGFGYFLYQPRGRHPSQHSHMWRWDEASTTISQIQALRGARNAGFKVPRRALERAADYIARSQHTKTGGFQYSIGSTPPRVSFVEGSNRPTFAITAACTAVLHALGTYRGPKVKAGVTYVESFIPPTRKKIPFFYYAHYYAAQVMHTERGARSNRWKVAIMRELASRQRPDGRWAADAEDTLASGDSEVLNTAWALQICQLDQGALPLHER